MSSHVFFSSFNILHSPHLFPHRFLCCFCLVRPTQSPGRPTTPRTPICAFALSPCSIPLLVLWAAAAADAAANSRKTTRTAATPSCWTAIATVLSSFHFLLPAIGCCKMWEKNRTSRFIAKIGENKGVCVCSTSNGFDQCLALVGATTGLFFSTILPQPQFFPVRSLPLVLLWQWAHRESSQVN